MSINPSPKHPALIDRFGIYFQHLNPDHHTLVLHDRSIACKNVKAALAQLGIARSFGDDPILFDQELRDAVMRFQQQEAHRNTDGKIGPNTRALLITRLLQRFGAAVFAKFDHSEVRRKPSVFFSYAWEDSAKVDKLDQWLQDNGINAIRDIRSFVAGSQISENILSSILSSDRVVAVYSANSKGRDWPTFEHEVCERVEELLRVPVLIYLRLDGTPLKAHDPHRIAIDGRGRKLREIGLEIQNALNPVARTLRIAYDEELPL